MPYVTNPYLIPHQIIKTMETGWKQAQTLDQCFKNMTAATSAQLFTLSGLKTVKGSGAPSPEGLGTQTRTHQHKQQVFSR